MTVVVFGSFGLIMGSFLNVVILRYGERGISGRSACVSCNQTLRWFDLIPVASWIVLRGRCRYCKKSISFQYPMVEVATGLLFVTIGSTGLPLLAVLIALSIAALLVCMFVYDLRHTIIPDRWAYPFSMLALTLSFLMRGPDDSLIILALSGPAAALPLFSLWALSRGQWMGFGDVKLALGMGWLLGFPFGVLAVLLGFVIGAIVSVGVLLPLPVYVRALARFTQHHSWRASGAGFTMTSEVPFGPFLIASTFIIWFALMYHVPIPIFSLYG